VWQAVDRDEPRFYEDLDRQAPPGYDRSKPRRYRTFITVPVRSGNTPVGLLTINAPTPGDLTRDDVDTLLMIAALLGNVLGLVENKWPVSGP
jgi:GAF domain-containing protein